MAKLLVICSRDPRAAPTLAARAAAVARRMAPDNLTEPTAPLVRTGDVVVALTSPVPGTRIGTSSVHVGHLQDEEGWGRVGGPVPDGTFAAARWDDDRIEVLTDVLASRTVWYVLDGDVFAASTSQRLLAAALDELDLDLAPVPWMLTTGWMGPDLAWDKRVRMLPGEARLVLDRRTWSVHVTRQPVVFEPVAGTDDEHRERLDAALREAVSAVELDPEHWVLPLSGGYDSRALLCLLPRRERLRTLTWGDPDAFERSESDAAVARRLAAAVGVSHTVRSTEVSGEGLDAVFDRFVACGEGRSASLAAYADGFALWRDLAEDGVHGVIRGDEGFGWAAVTGERDVRRYLRLIRWDDHAGLPPLARLGLDEQVVPEELERRPEESVEAWRDRLYHVYRAPVALAALSDLKLPYVEIANPLLHRSLVRHVRTMPDHLRTDKSGFKDVVRGFVPDVAFARLPAIADARDLVRSPAATEVLRTELTSAAARAVLPPELLDHIVAGLQERRSSGSGRRALIRRLAGRLPQPAESVLRRTVAPPTVQANTLGFRALVVARTARVLAADHAAARAAGPLGRP